VLHFRAALHVQPNHIAALNDLAWILATERNPEIRNVSEAIRLGARACQLSVRTNAACLDTLGTAFAEASRWAEAIEATEKALAIAEAAGQEQLAAEFRSHLQLYRTKSARQPLH
jgi:tetratricopeptide (TPR) repeat protein